MNALSRWYSDRTIARWHGRRFTGARWLLASVLVCSGASCPVRPCELSHGADLPEVLAILNRNNELVYSLFAPDVDISGRSEGQLFFLNAKLAFEKPRRFRLVAASSLGSQEVDLGSNDELFWFWVARSQPPALYYCRHDEYAQGRLERTLPLDPDWIIESLGIESLDPGDQHEGPFVSGGGRIEFRTRRLSPQGQPITKVIVVDACHGWIVEQHLYDATGRRLASARLSEHRRDSALGVVLPRRIELTWPDADLSLTLNLRDVRVNQVPVHLEANLWSKPERNQEVNLCRPAEPVAQTPAHAPPTPRPFTVDQQNGRRPSLSPLMTTRFPEP